MTEGGRSIEWKSTCNRIGSIFPGAGREMRSARLDLCSDGEPVAFALSVHYFTCSKNLNAVVNISRALDRAGIAVLRFDFTSIGESEGDFANSTFSSEDADLPAAAEFLGREHRPPGILIGHSLGGSAELQTAANIPSVRAVETVGDPAIPQT